MELSMDYKPMEKLKNSIEKRFFAASIILLNYSNDSLTLLA
jgi:hypothetical protein